MTLRGTSLASASSPQVDPTPWLVLLQAPGVGPMTYRRILEHYGTPQTFLDCHPNEWQRCGLLPRTALDYLRDGPRDPIETTLKWAAAQSNHHILTFADTHYPALLREIPDPPPVLFVRGEVTGLNRPQLAVVGSRNPTPGGRENAHAFAHHMAQAGLAITSGLAVGIDSAAHEGALDGGGFTLAAAGTGPDQVYPARNRALAERIAAQGAIVSELPPGTPPRPEHFPRRNRIISGLSRGTLVVEAAVNSGSLITARLAMEQNREVFAIPGSIHNPLARGCHALIRQGAKLVENAQDIWDELGQMDALGACLPPLSPPSSLEHVAQASLGEGDRDGRALLSALGEDATSVDTLIERSGLTAERVCSILLVFELHGVVATTPAGLYVRTAVRG